ncbi:hypothetical protein DN757_29705 [Paenibacillus silvae]|uniref:Uncharacterized protein n=2 Tax=Paenibacillus silvae TaxID=1325358 RepID=A0A2W6Q3Y3_9BACL|nr:hypothetical protein DN757_29705 [Paenibacillus silvae]
MKQKLKSLDIHTLYEIDQKRLAIDLGCQLHQLQARVTIGGLIEVIRQYHQIILYTVDECWCVQLFEHDEATNDAESCCYENSGTELIELLYTTMEWIYDRLNDN